MKKNETYRLCIKAGHLEQTPVFKIKVGKFEKIINTYYIPSDKQRYNYDIFVERNKEPEIMIEVFANEKMLGQGVLKFDSEKPDMPNEIIDIMDNKKKVGSLQCSLKKVEKKNKKPPMKIRIISGSFLENLDTVSRMDPFVVIKYADNNYKTNVCQEGGKTPIWKEQFNIGTSENDRIFLEAWEEDINSSEFIGVGIVDIASKIGVGEVDIDVTKDKVKQGTIKIELTENNTKKPDSSQKQVNDKNIVKKRNLKTYAVEAVMKQQIKKGGFIKLQTGEQDYETTPIFTDTKQLKWNQSFQIKAIPGEQLVAKLCLKQEIEEEIGRASIKINDITNKKYELSLMDPNGAEIGKLYLEFYDEELDIKQDIQANPSTKQIKEEQKSAKVQKQKAQVKAESKGPEKQGGNMDWKTLIANQQKAPVSQPTKVNEEKPNPIISSEIHMKINNKHEQIKKIYANRQSIHDYMSEVNAVLQQGLIMIARERPQDPIKHLGLFLINYKK